MRKFFQTRPFLFGTVIGFFTPLLMGLMFGPIGFCAGVLACFVAGFIIMCEKP